MNGHKARQLPGNARWRSPSVIGSGRSVTGPKRDPVARSLRAGGLSPLLWRARAGEMLQEESDLSLVIAQIVQKLKGSNLYAQLERQAWVSEAGWGGMETGGAAATPGLRHRSPQPGPVSRLSSCASVHGETCLLGERSTCSTSREGS